MRVNNKVSPLVIDSDLSAFRMADLVRLRDHISVTLNRRFKSWLALAFTDIVDSTAHFMASGDVAGETLQQRHLDLVFEAVSSAGGRIVDTAGDGTFSCFAAAKQATEALICLQRAIAVQNSLHSRDEQLLVRSAIHWGEVLADGSMVKGCAVNLCARIACVSLGGQILITGEAFKELMKVTQQRCQSPVTLSVKSFPDPVDVFELDWSTPDRHEAYGSAEAPDFTKLQPALGDGEHLWSHPFCKPQCVEA